MLEKGRSLALTIGLAGALTLILIGACAGADCSGGWAGCAADGTAVRCYHTGAGRAADGTGGAPVQTG